MRWQHAGALRWLADPRITRPAARIPYRQRSRALPPPVRPLPRPSEVAGEGEAPFAHLGLFQAAVVGWTRTGGGSVGACHPVARGHDRGITTAELIEGAPLGVVRGVPAGEREAAQQQERVATAGRNESARRQDRTPRGGAGDCSPEKRRS